MNEERRRKEDKLTDAVLDSRFGEVNANLAHMREVFTLQLDTILFQVTQINGGVKKNCETIEAHDERIDRLENWRWYVLGIASAIGLMMSLFVHEIWGG